MLRYLLILAAVLAGCSKPVEKIVLSPQEQLVVNTRELRVCHSATGNPIQWVNDGQSDGISIDYIKLVAERTGFSLRFIPQQNQAEAVDAFVDRKCDVLAAVKPLPERYEYMSFTPAYLLFGSTMLVRSMPIQYPVKVGFGRKYSIQPSLKYLVGQAEVVAFDNDEESFKALIAGQIGAIVLDELSAWRIQKQYKLKFPRAPVDFQYDISMGFHKDDAIIGEILTRGLASITLPEKQEIFNRHIND